MKQKSVIIAIIFQLAGLFCFLTFWLMYFAILFFVVGTIVICISRVKWYIIIFAVSPMLFVIGTVVNATYYEKYIIPENFRGVVYVITDEEKGKEREYEFFTRIYRIPRSGILLTKFNQKSGFNRRSFFQQTKLGVMAKLGELDDRDYIEKWVINPPSKEPSRDSLAVFTPEFEFDHETKKYKLIFTIGKYKDVHVWNYLPKEKIDSIIAHDY
jgi:energy-coupling factor transporter transmembrane protein EcfT